MEDLTGVAGELLVQLTRATTLLDAAEARANRLQDELVTHLQQLQAREAELSEERRLQVKHLRGVEDRAHKEVDRACQEARELKRFVDVAVREKQAADEAAVARAEANAHRLRNNVAITTCA